MGGALSSPRGPAGTRILPSRSDKDEGEGGWFAGRRRFRLPCGESAGAVVRGIVRVAVAGGLALLPAVAQADCRAPATQLEMTVCAEADWQAADADLNAAYRAARGAMQAADAGWPAAQRGAEVALRDAQRAWIAFRDNACAAEGWPFRGGSAEPMVVYGCRARLTRDRAADLWALAAGR